MEKDSKFSDFKLKTVLNKVDGKVHYIQNLTLGCKVMNACGFAFRGIITKFLGDDVCEVYWTEAFVKGTYSIVPAHDLYRVQK